MEKLKTVVEHFDSKGIEAKVENGTIYVYVNDYELEISQFEIDFQYKESLEK